MGNWTTVYFKTPNPEYMVKEFKEWVDKPIDPYMENVRDCEFTYQWEQDILAITGNEDFEENLEWFSSILNSIQPALLIDNKTSSSIELFSNCGHSHT